MSSTVVHPDQLQKLIDQLPDFLDELRAQGYKIGVQEYITAKSLLFKLNALGSLPATLNALSEWLTPLLATTPEEQRAFSSDFDKWLARVFPPEPLPEPVPPRPLGPGPGPAGVTPKPPLWFANLNLYRQYVALIAVAVIVIAVMLFAGRNSAPTNPNANGNGNGNINRGGYATQDPSPTPSTSPIKPPPTPTEIRQFGYASIIPPPGSSSSGGSWYAPEESWYSKNFFWVLGTASSMPLALFVFWWGWNLYQRRLQLQRWNSIQKPRLDRIPVEGIRNKIFHGGSFRRIARELRRHRRLHSKRLDIHATVGVTSRRGGLFTPVYGKRRALPEYLVLIDRVGYKDQQANYDNEIVNRLVENDVFIDRYFFQGDPNWCSQGGPESPQRSLQDLAGRHPDHHLIIFSEGEGLINPLTGQPHEWLKTLSQWRARALITPLPVLDWSYREWVLSRSDFTVVPASLRGMQHLVESISAEGLLKRPGPDDSRPYPALLDQKPELWSQREEPSQVNKLCAQLKRFLDDPGYYLLCACAVYPSLQWELTLYLAFQLLTREQIDQCLASLVRLPWLRYGFTPDWLRSRLIADLGPERERLVRRHLQHLLLTYLKDPQNPIPLPYASQTSIPEDSALIDKVKERLSDWWKWRQLRRYIKPAPDRNLLHDEVFLNFMSRSRLAFAIPNLLRRYFLRSGKWQLGLRSLPAFSMAMLASIVILSTLLLTHPVLGLPPMEPAPSQLAAPALMYSPTKGLNGTDVSFMVTSSIPNTYDFRGMTLFAPGRSGVAVDRLKPVRDKVEATVHVERNAKPEQIELTLRDVNGNAFARLPFEVGNVVPTDNRRQLQIQFLNPDGSTFRERVPFVLNRLGAGYPKLNLTFRGGGSTSMMQAGLVEPGMYQITVPSDFEISHALPETLKTIGPLRVSIPIPVGSGFFQITLFMANVKQCASAPLVSLPGNMTINEGPAATVEVKLIGKNQEILDAGSEPFSWEAVDDLGRTLELGRSTDSTAKVLLETKGLANRTITVRVAIGFTQFGFFPCLRTSSMKIFVIEQNPPPPVRPTSTPTTEESPASGELDKRKPSTLKVKAVIRFSVPDEKNPRLTCVWAKNSDSTWTFKSLSSGTGYIDVIGSITVDGMSGTLLRNRKLPELEYFIPNDTGKGGVWLFRTRENGGEWSTGKEMRNLRFGDR